MSSVSVVAALGHAAAGRLEQARAGLRAHVARQWRDAEAIRVLATLDLRAGAAEMGRFGLRRAGELGDAQAWYLLGLELARTEAWPEAAEAFERSTDLNPGEPLAWGEMAMMAIEQGSEVHARACLASARAHAPSHPDTPRQFVRVLLRLGDFAGALAACREILADPRADALGLHTSAYAMNNLAGVDESELAAAHRRLGEVTVREHGPAKDPSSFTNARDPDRPLRVALLSCDFRQHSCAYFLLGLVPHLAAHGMEVFLYSSSAVQDHVTAAFRVMGTWREVAASSPAAVAQLAMADGIDIVLDLSGWTAPGQMHALARRLAPVQATYLGYPNTTGLATVDARFVDATTDPAERDAYATEWLLRLPAPLVRYTPPEAAIHERGPARPFTFGSFNAGSKVTPDVMRAWAAILAANPGTHLVIKRHSLSEPSLGRHKATLSAAGIDPARLSVLPFTKTPDEHLAQYARVDVALDTFPYNGTTTTCEALWMGVPVVAMEGEAHRSRVGVSLLSAVGATDWIARDEAAYVAIAGDLARAGPRDAAARQALRARLAASVLCDHAGLAGAMSASLRALWREWCRDGRIARGE